jgi:hypothetical protein
MSNQPNGVLLTYNGALYEIEATVAKDLAARGLIIADPEQPGAYRVSPAHTFDEVDPFTTPVWRKQGFDATSEKMRMLSSHRDGQGGR